MKHIKRYNENIDDMWTSTSTNNKEYEIDYTSKNSIYHGVRSINVSRNGIRAQVKAKFDSGAKSSSIDFKVAKKLGLSEHFIATCKKLDSVDLSKYTKDARNISLLEQRRIEDLFFKELKKAFPEIVAVKLVKSSSGFSMRMTIGLNIEYNGKVIQTDANVRDRRGLSCEMLVGLKDM